MNLLVYSQLTALGLILLLMSSRGDLSLSQPNPTQRFQYLRAAGRTADGILEELHRIATEFESLGVGERPYFEVLEAHGWKSPAEVRIRKIRESHQLIAALGAKLDTLTAAINEQPPAEPAA